MNNDKVNNPMMDFLKKVNISTTLVTKLTKNSGPMVVDFGTKKDMEDYINKVKKHQLPKEFFDRFIKEKELNEDISKELTEEFFKKCAKELNEELNDELREKISKMLRKKVDEDLREKLIEEFYEGIEIFKPYLENNKFGLIRIFQLTNLVDFDIIVQSTPIKKGTNNEQHKENQEQQK